MLSVKVDAFFSCSFDEGDQEVNELFVEICRALGLQLTNVSTASSSTPPEVAKKKIAESQALIAVCTRRSEFKDGGYAMPQAVHDEISFAYGKDVPVLLIVEDGVDLKGFKSNFGTYLPFDRSKLYSGSFIGKAVEAVHDLKLSVVMPHNVGVDHGISESHADYMKHLIELKCQDGKFTWCYDTTKKLVYSKPSKRGFPSSVWAIVPANLPESPQNIEWNCHVKSSSRNISLDVEVESHSATAFEAILKPTPHPEDGDFIEYNTFAASPYINPVWVDEVGEGGKVHLNDGDYQCADGLICIHRTKKAIIEFRMPKEYGFSISDLRPFVGSYTSSVDYEVESELRRASIRNDDFGGNLSIRFEIDSPLPGHMYGVAWNPKVRPA